MKRRRSSARACCDCQANPNAAAPTDPAPTPCRQAPTPPPLPTSPPPHPVLNRGDPPPHSLSAVHLRINIDDTGEPRQGGGRALGEGLAVQIFWVSPSHQVPAGKRQKNYAGQRLPNIG